MTTSQELSPTLTRAADAEALTGDPGCLITLLADAASTCGALTSNRSAFAKGADGAPPHSHEHLTELFFVLDGALQVLVGDEITVLEAGDLLVVPPGTTHAFAAAPGRTADVLFVFTPGRERFEYYRHLDRLHRGEGSWDELDATQDRFDNHSCESTAWQAARGA
jgi:mannose-6-phosphate isomerase-like protein (cupin superfamily)